MPDPPKIIENDLKKTDFFIVGIGASAGGLDAFTELLQGISADSKMGFVLIQHLDPTHHSLLTELLSKSTRLPVNEVVDGAVVQPGHIYVIPPNSEMSIAGGTLHLSGRKNTEARNMSIDAFFRSLAEDRKEWAVGIVLSGSESDGVLGLEAIKSEGGITFAQDEASAKYKDMPRKAAAGGVVDFVLPPKGIAQHLSRLPDPLRVAFSKAPEKRAHSEKEEKILTKILDLLKIKTGMDFAFYKPATILSRISRRMVLSRMDDLEIYFRYLRRNVKEVQALRKDLLINVTSFFRDPASFDLLKKKIFPEIVKRRQKNAPIRIWIPGCSTGNEAYSIAICLDEFLKYKNAPIQIFATDVSDAAVEIARRGIYPENIKIDVSPQRLERYFQKTGDGYQIKKYIRDLCVFATHNMISDPPFSEMDLISCRNVLIYMESLLQKKAISHFHYSLKSLSFLILGGSETVGGFSDFFTPLDKRHKIYVKKNPLKGGRRLNFATAGFEKKFRPLTTGRHGDTAKANAFDARKEAAAILSREKFKDGVLVTEEMEIIEFFGYTEPYIRHKAGQASFNLLHMVHENLLPDLCIAIYKAKTQKRPVRKPSLAAGASKFVDIYVIPMQAPSSNEFYFLILLKKSALAPAPVPISARALTIENRQIKQELVLAKASLMAIMREQSSMTEDFRCQNEEIQSNNEEFQSTNEELETAKEELQSTNEELSTVNNEMEVRNCELIQINDDLNNIILNDHSSTLLLDADLKIRLFSANAGKALGIVSADIGRRISDIAFSERIKNLEGFLRNVIESTEPKERELEEGGLSYLMRGLCYRRHDGKVDGAVLFFIDITDLKHSMAKIEEGKKYSDTIVETLWEPLVALDSRLHIKSVNASFYEFFEVDKNETSGALIYDLGNGQWNIPELKELLEKLIRKNDSFHNLRMEHNFPKIGHKVMLLNAHKINPTEDKKDEIIILAFQDITHRARAEKALKASADELAHSNSRFQLVAQAANDILWDIDLAADTVWWGPGMRTILGYPLEAVGHSRAWYYDHIHPDDKQRVLLGMKEAFTEGEKTWADEFRFRRANGTYAHVADRASIIRDSKGLAVRMVGAMQDVTEKKRINEGLRQSEQRYRALFNSIDEGFCIVETLFDEAGKCTDYRFLDVNEAFERQSGLREAQGKTMREMFPEHEEHWFEAFGAVAKTGEARRFQNRAAELSRWFDVYAFRTGAPAERRVGILFTDITERMNLEEDFKRVHRELEQFTSIASHDLQEPLRKIMIYTEKLGLAVSEEDKHACLEKLSSSAGRMKKLIEALLDFSRADHKREFHDVHLKEIVAKVIEDLEANSLAEIEVGDLPVIQGDAILIHQLFQNMISNSLKYRTKERACKIFITSRTVLGRHEITVRDNGIGFDEKYVDRIFKPFQRLHSRSSEYEGTGIGLATCEKIARHHKATISARGKVGEGASFVVSFP